MQNSSPRLIIGAIIAVVLLSLGVTYAVAHRPAPPPIVITSAIAPTNATINQASSPPASANPIPASPPASQPVTKYYVHVAGAVRYPSLYLLPAGTRVMQAIKAAGGPAHNADLDAVNLAEKVADGEKVYIPTKAPAGVVTTMVAAPGNTIDHASNMPASVPSSSHAAAGALPLPTSSITKKAKAGVSKSAKLSSPSQGQVDINTAGADQLERLPGIGPAMAGRILAYRQQAGGFQKVEELQEITGIGPKKYAKISPLVKLQ